MYFIFSFLFTVCCFVQSFAQCAMCTAAAESAIKEGNMATAGINAGILYLLCAPFLIIGVLGFFIWKNLKTN